MATLHADEADPRILRKILKQYIKSEQEVLDSGAYSLEQEVEAREKIRQASVLRLFLRTHGVEDLLP